ncbi:MAG: T9SS type A sorting domain-containing protein, partial [Owenweeksia sp.]
PYPRESEINLTVIVVPQIGISESMSEMGIGVYPNPARDHVEFSGIEQYGSIEVFLNDMNGKLLLRKELSDSGNNQLELSGLPSGTYIVKGVVDNGSTFRKLIVKE